MVATKFLAAVFGFYVGQLHAAPVERCVGPICVMGKQNFSQFKKKWNAYESRKIPIEKGSYPSLCLWNDEMEVSYIFDFIGHYGTTDEPISNTRLGQVRIVKTPLCKKKGTERQIQVFCSGIGNWIGRDKNELLDKWGKPDRIDDGNDSYISSFEPKYKVENIYMYFLDGQNELLFNAFGIDKNGKISDILISEVP